MIFIEADIYSAKITNDFCNEKEAYISIHKA
jgi:hypothetical protein